MKDQERSDKIKKFIITLLLIITSLSFVYAEENNEEYLDVTDNIEIRYKWYKKTLNDKGDYYPLKDITEDDIVDETKTKYVTFFTYSPKNCSLPTEYYKINRAYIRTYTIYKASYVLIENINKSDDIKIYYNNQMIDYEVISNEDKQIKINLKKEYLCENLLFEINSSEKYKINLYIDSLFNELSLSKELENIQSITPDKTWITEFSKYKTLVTIDNLKESDLTTFISKELSCSYKEKYIYAYKSLKEYYDNNYHANINEEGYIKDETDYRIFYKGKPLTITNTVEVIKEKIVKVPQIEYVYIENDIIKNDIENNDPSKEKESLLETIPETKIETEIKTQFIEKEIFKIPKQIYFIILILIILILLLAIKLYKKYVG